MSNSGNYWINPSGDEPGKGNEPEDDQPGSEADMQKTMAFMGAFAVTCVIVFFAVSTVIGLLVTFPPLGVVAAIALVVWLFVR